MRVGPPGIRTLLPIVATGEAKISFGIQAVSTMAVEYERSGFHFCLRGPKQSKNCCQKIALHWYEEPQS